MQENAFDVALSFAGEDRSYVAAVADYLKANGVKVFYDEFEQVNLWGKNLYDHLSDVYQSQATFTVMFISEHYAKKLWTNLERQSAQARAFQEAGEYILPVRFDDTPISGVLPTTGFLDLRKMTPEQLGVAICGKLEIQKYGAEATQEHADTKAPTDPGPKPTLIDAFNTDIPQAEKLSVGEITVMTEAGPLLTAKPQVYRDFDLRTTYVGFYLPEPQLDFDGSKTTVACLKLIDAIDQVLEAHGDLHSSVADPGSESFRRSIDLTFSRRVYIYYEGGMSSRQIAEVVWNYHAKNLDVVLRGTSYITPRLQEWFFRQGSQ